MKFVGDLQKPNHHLDFITFRRFQPLLDWVRKRIRKEGLDTIRRLLKGRPVYGGRRRRLYSGEISGHWGRGEAN